ncbi:MFS transporter [Cohnella candidum]|uniref:MFS transporter n=1 Tax=Cohnella candidum TaxID=2674991 RepID=A0A3G3K3Q1_9BACL|nr:MFS transporter [Cohnella candidum]AYQ75113.1 MFS transporter [Cohnella candidum]
MPLPGACRKEGESLDSVSRRQLWAIVGISSLLSVVFSGLDVAFTVFSVNRLELPASDLALLRSLRLAVTIPFILAMGGIADAWGQKKTATAAIVVMSAASVLTVAIPGKGMLFATFPLYGGMSAILLVSMNVFSQGVKDELRGLSNTLYRSTFIGFSIAGPLSAGLLIGFGFPAAFLAFAAIALFSLAALSLYPQDRREAGASKETVRQTAARMAEGWKSLLRDRPLLTYMLMNGLLNHTVMVNLVLVPVKLMDDLGVSSRDYTRVMTVSSIIGLLFTIAAGFLMKKHLSRLITMPMLLSAACNFASGLESSVWLTIVLFILSSALYTVTMAPTSLWLGEMAKQQFGTIFGIFKVMSAGIGFLVSASLSVVQSGLGIDMALVAYGIFGVLASLLFMRLMSKWQAAAGRKVPDSIRQSKGDVTA